MKRFVLMAMVALSLIICVPAANAQREYSKDCIKRAQKMAKNKAKELKKQNYQISSMATMEDVLYEFYLETGSCGEFEGKTADCNDANSINIARNYAQEQIHREILKRFNDEIQGAGESSIESVQVNGGKDGSTSTETIKTELLHKYKGKLNNVAREVLLLYKKNAAGKYDVQVFYTLNKVKLAQLEREMSGEFENSQKRSEAIRQNVRNTWKEFEE